jgi:hypothetical protein
VENQRIKRIQVSGENLPYQGQIIRHVLHSRLMISVSPWIRWRVGDFSPEKEKLCSGNGNGAEHEE